MGTRKGMALGRKDFIRHLSMMATTALCIRSTGVLGNEGLYQESSFSKKLTPIGRALEMKDYYVWCNSPIIGPDGKTHVFFSRWKASLGMSGWIKGCEIAHAIADAPDQAFEYVQTVLEPRGEGFWDATTCHNPLIKEIDGKYYLFYMGNANGKTDTKRIGVAIAESLFGPWKRQTSPILLPGDSGAWDDHCTTNPAWVNGHNGQSILYYKSWNTYDYETTTGSIRGNRKYGLAFAPHPEGPYEKYKDNPVVDFAAKGNNRQFEDAFVWKEAGVFKMIARDMGVYGHDVGLIMESKDGFHWSEPKIAYYALSRYIEEPPAPPHLKRYGRLERPMLLMENNRPKWLFGASQGGKFQTSSAFVFKCE